MIRTKSGKEFALECLKTLDENIVLGYGDEDEAMKIAESHRFLNELIEDVFAFDFFKLQDNIRLIMKKLEIESEEVIEVGKGEIMKRYYLCLPSHCEAPDFEAEVEATSKEEALEFFKMYYGRTLHHYDDDFLLAEMGEEIPF